MGDPIWRDQGRYIIAETAEGRFGSTVFGRPMRATRRTCWICELHNLPSYKKIIASDALESNVTKGTGVRANDRSMPAFPV
jgi:hypothetical protein